MFRSMSWVRSQNFRSIECAMGWILFRLDGRFWQEKLWFLTFYSWYAEKPENEMNSKWFSFSYAPKKILCIKSFIHFNNDLCRLSSIRRKLAFQNNLDCHNKSKLIALSKACHRLTTVIPCFRYLESLIANGENV